ncbi:hypothetical protein PENTCL1PPCAC_20130, partial [Pristionchus entomophagus]
TISSDGAGLLEPISSQTKAFSCTSINTDESDGLLRISITSDDGVTRDPRTASKHKYFAPNGDRNFISKYFQPSFQERSREFHKLFESLVPPDEQMLASFGCAYQREILVQGRIFISSRHFCFYANIFGWGTIFAIPMIDVTEITKEKAVFIFPNSIQLNTDARGRFFFASFANREKSLKVMQLAWKQVHDGGRALTPDQLWELMNPTEQRKEEKHAKEKPEKRSSKRKKGSTSVSSADEPSMLKTASAPRLDLSSEQQQQRAAAGACPAVSPDDTDVAERSSSSSTTDISMTECICDDHTGKKLLDQVFLRSPSELFDLCFTSSPWFVQLNSSLKRTAHSKMPQKYSGYSASDWATDKDGVRQRTVTYTMSLNHAMAPKSCVVTEKQVYKAFPGGYTIIKETHNSNVPYSESFHVLCTYCVMGYGRGQSRLVVHGALIFSKSVWGMIRGYIERSTTQGLADHYDALLSALNEECKRSAGGADGLALEDDQNRMDTSSEEGGEADNTATVANLRGMAGSISGINFVQNATRGHEEPSFHLPLVGRVRRIDFYGIGILSLLALMSLTLIILVMRLPSHSTPDSRLAEAFERYLSPVDGSAPPPARPDLDSLIAAIGRIGAQLQQVRDAAANGEL